MKNSDIRATIEEVFRGEKNLDVCEFSSNLLNVLGYFSERLLTTDGSPEEFFSMQESDTLSRQSLLKRLSSIHVVFQITEEEIKQTPIKGRPDCQFNDIAGSLIFVATQLEIGDYSRTEYANFAREINKRFPGSPVVVIFRKSSEVATELTIAFVNRRPNKTDDSRDVLQHVILIKDIDVDHPHRAHLDSLSELSLENSLKWISANDKQRDFQGLQEAWLAKLDTEQLNKRFYDELYAWFQLATQICRFPTSDRKRDAPENHVIRLITRLIFVWFLKQKGLVSEGLFQEAIVNKLLLNFDSATGDSYYRAILQNLFFATLNSKIENRQFSKGKITHRNFFRYRYENQIAQPDELLHLFHETPFINGGLFDCLDSEESESEGGYRIDCFTDFDEHQKLLSIPNRLFFDRDEGLFRIFDKYKFTVEENTPIEQEVALDPELLGNVFENLLAAYDQELNSTVRRATGSFYTPRPIVEYMVRKSIVQSITSNFGHSGAESYSRKLEYLVDPADAFDDVDQLFSSAEREHLVEQISSIQILDPAVGSGAFLMQSLLTLTLALRRLDPDNALWRKAQQHKAISDAEEAYVEEGFLSNSILREDFLKQISENFDRYRESDYGRKLYLIQNSLFGVDNQVIACQISKLRFFISLTIEQSVSQDPRDNYGIQPLPNLETRIIAADTLRPLPSWSHLTSVAEDQARLALKLNRKSYFNVHTREHKKSCQEIDRANRAILNQEFKKTGLAPSDAQKIANWNPFDSDSSADWFDPEYMFDMDTGFDIVLGNPPYIQLQKNGGELRKKYSDLPYASFSATGDIYCLFIERGFELLRDSGHLCYITSNKWLRADYGKNLRLYLSSRTKLKELIDFGGYRVFESAIVDTSILLLQKSAPSNELSATRIDRRFNHTESLRQHVRSVGTTLKDLTAEPWIIGTAEELALRNKLESLGEPLKKNNVWGISIYYGIKTGLNRAFIVDNETKEGLVRSDKNSAELLKPLLRGRDIKRYRANWAGNWLIATMPSKSVDISKYPAIENHLRSFGENQLEQAGKTLPNGIRTRKKTPHKWYELQDTCAYHAIFEQEKVIYPDIMGLPSNSVNETDVSIPSSFPYMYLDRHGFYAEATNFILTSRFIRSVFAILTSKFGVYAFTKFYTGPSLGDKGIRYKKSYLSNFPLVRLNEYNLSLLSEIDELVNTMQAAFEVGNGDRVKSIEQQINQLVYRLYELTDEEVNLICSMRDISV